MKKILFAALFAVVVSLNFGQYAQASIVHISGSGTWDFDAPITSYSSPGTSWTFDFNLPNPFSLNPTTEFTNFTFLLNGTAISDTLSAVQFFSEVDGGLFSLLFTSGGRIDMFGEALGGPFANLGDPALPPPYSLASGNYQVFQINTLSPQSEFAFGSGSLTVSAVPELTTWAMMLLGFASVGLLAHRRSRKVFAAV